MQLRCDIVQWQRKVAVDQQRGGGSVGVHRPRAEVINRHIRLQSSSHLSVIKNVLKKQMIFENLIRKTSSFNWMHWYACLCFNHSTVEMNRIRRASIGHWLAVLAALSYYITSRGLSGCSRSRFIVSSSITIACSSLVWFRCPLALDISGS